MDLFLGREEGTPLAQRLYEQLREAIASGRLQAGDRLPATRQLAGQLGVSRHTVTTAYDRLVAEGYVQGRAGGGSVVSPLLLTPPPPARRPSAVRPARRFQGWAPYFQPRGECRFDLRPGLPDPALFPATAWRRRLAAAAGSGFRYGSPAGDAGLRRAVAAWVARSRSVAASGDTVLITAGSQQAIDLVARVLLEPGDCVAVEEPGYQPVARLLRTLGAEVVPVPVDGQGLMVDLLPSSARIIYTTPSHQYPLGMTMSLPRRLALLRWAGQRDAVVIEDDYDSEFRYVSRPLEPIQRLDEHGREVYVGSFSKTFAPSLRLGFAVVPEPLVTPLAAVRQCTDWHSPAATQAALAGFIADGLLDQHVRRCRRVYAERRRLLTDALAGPLGRHLSPLPSHAGLHIAATLRGGLREDQALAAASARGIAAFGLSSCFQAGPGRQGLLLGFGAVSTADLPEALRELAGALSACLP